MDNDKRVLFEETDVWLIPNNRTDGLKDLCSDLNGVKNVLEIGSSRGISTRIFLENFDHVTTIDINYNEEFDFNISEFKHKLNKLTGDSLEIHPFIKDESLDLIYLDSDHSYDHVKSEIKFYFPKLKNTGYLSGHDYCYYGIGMFDTSGVIRAVNRLLGYPDHVYRDTSWLFGNLNDRQLGF